MRQCYPCGFQLGIRIGPCFLTTIISKSTQFMLHSLTSFYVLFQVIKKKKFHFDEENVLLLLRYLCFMFMSLSWLYFVRRLGYICVWVYHFRLTHLWLTENDFITEGSLKNRRAIGWNQSNSVKLCYLLELRNRYLRWCGGELLSYSHQHSNEGIQMPQYMYNKTM